MAPLTITRLHPSLGAEVAGVDLARPLDEPTRQALADLKGPVHLQVFSTPT